jgi:hypothetical protein
MAALRSKIRSLVSPDGALILDIEQDRMIRLNQTGGEVWMGLQRGKHVDEIAREMAASTGADFDLVRRDVQDFCLLLRSLLERTR